MALTVFRGFGGLINDTPTGWASDTVNIGARLYQQGGSAPQTGWQTLEDMTTNGWVEANTSASSQLIPDLQRTFGGWDFNSHFLNYTLTDQVNFGAGGQGDTLGGIAVYLEILPQDNQRKLLWWDDSNVNGVPVATGDCIWGSAGVSNAVSVQSIIPPTQPVFFMQQGKVDWHNLALVWTSAEDFKLRLYNVGGGGATTPSSDQNLQQITQPRCQQPSPPGGDVTDVIVAQGARSIVWDNIDSAVAPKRWEFRITPPAFQSYSFGTVASGQQPDAVALARGDLATSDADSELWYWDGGISTAPLVGDREITYGPPSTFVAFYSEPT